MEKETKKPVFEQRVGAIRVTIWENRDKNKEVFHTTNIVRRYKAGDGPDDWKDSTSFTGLSDLAHLGQAYQLAQAFLSDYVLENYGSHPSATKAA